MKRFLTLFLAILMTVGLFAQAAIISFADDPVEISNYGGYSTILRKKGDGSILFSPYLLEVQSAVSAGAALTDFSVNMTFKLLTGNNGQVIYTFPTVTAAPQTSNGSYYDIFLKGTKGDCGFCPTAERYYDIYVEVFKNDELFCYGTYQSLQAPSAYSSSSYYDPTPVSKEIASRTTYNGIRQKSNGAILFSPFVAELRAMIDNGAQYTDFTTDLTFSLVESGEVTATWNPVTVTLGSSNGKYFDAVLQGSGVDCGFCPTADAVYNVYVEVYKLGELLFYGTYESVTAASAISGSAYYAPSAIPSPYEVLSETTEGFTGTVYPGSAFIADANGIYFAAYMTELRTVIDGGANIADYSINLQIAKIVNGAPFVTFQKIMGADLVDAGSYFKVPLKSANVSLFCPEAGKTYTVAVEIMKNDKMDFKGTYTGATTAADLADSLFYEPVTGATEIASCTTYNGIRKKSNGAILFSPFVAELRALISSGAAYTDFVTELTFTLLDNGTPASTWAPVTVSLGSSNGQYFDAVLQGSGVDCGFCPTANASYNIYVEIFKQGELMFYGTYENITAADAISSSTYYRPTPDPNAPVDFDMTLTYVFFNNLKGSAAGSIGVVSDGTGYFELCWADANGEKLTATVGNKTLSYAPLSSFTLSESVQTYRHVVLNFTAIPQGAAKLAAYDVVGRLIAAFDLPAEKLLDAAEYTYSFGVVSDVHYEYFYHVAEVDDALKAFNTAIAFFDAAGADLLTAVGDYSKYAEEAAYQKYAAAIANTDMIVLACGGNHELYANIETMFGQNGLFRTYVNPAVYGATPDAGVKNIAPNGIDFVYEIPGKTDSVFIFLSQWFWDGHTAAQEHLVTPEQIAWLTEQFAAYADRTVFFYFHTYLFDDDGETFDGEGDLTGPAGYTYNAGYNQATEDEGQLRALLTQYKNVIFFNGHSHYLYEMQKYNPNLNIYDYEGTTATMIHVPSLTNPRLVTDTSSTSYSSTNGSESQAALMLVYDGYEIMNGLNVWKDEILSEACYIIYNDKTDVVETQTTGDVTMIYDEQGQTLRFEGEGEIPAALIAAAQSYASVVKNIYVCKGITAIPAAAFENFTALTRAEIKETVLTIGENAFAGCTALETFVYGGSTADYAEMTIGGGNAALTGAARSYDQYVVTWIVDGETTVEQYRHYKVPTYPGKPVKLSADGTQIYPFTGWNSGSKTYAAGTDLPKVMSNVTYTAQFSSTATDRYVSGTLTNNTTITWSLDRYTGELLVTGSGAMDDFEQKGAPWYAYQAEIVSVFVGGTITATGRFSFANLTALKTVICGSSVTALHADSFSYDSALETLIFHAPITSVGQGTVYSSGNIKTVGLTGQTKKQFQALLTAAYNDGYNAASFTTHVLETTEAVPASCLEGGFTAGVYCTTCQLYVGGHENTPATGHNWGEWTVTPATFTEGGSKTHTCADCGNSETLDIEKAVLGLHDEAFIGEKDGKPTATFVGTISEKDLDLTCIDRFVVKITYEKNGTTKTSVVNVRTLYTTITGIATTAADLGAVAEEAYIDASYLFAVRMVGVPEGEHTVSVSIEAVTTDGTIAEVSSEFTFTID